MVVTTHNTTIEELFAKQNQKANQVKERIISLLNNKKRPQKILVFKPTERRNLV